MEKWKAWKAAVLSVESWKAKAQNKKITQLPVPKWLMKIAFQSIGRKDHYEKIYGEFHLNVDKALATGWKPSPIDCRNFEL